VHYRQWWWLYGAGIASGTGLLMGLFFWLHLREVKRRAARLRATEQLCHDVRNALQILMHRGVLPAGCRTEIEDEAIERIHSATREMLPDCLEKPGIERPPSKPLFKVTKDERINDDCA
jgi:hypothetical protein